MLRSSVQRSFSWYRLHRFGKRAKQLYYRHSRGSRFERSISHYRRRYAAVSRHRCAPVYRAFEDCYPCWYDTASSGPTDCASAADEVRGTGKHQNSTDLARRRRSAACACSAAPPVLVAHHSIDLSCLLILPISLARPHLFARLPQHTTPC